MITEILSYLSRIYIENILKSSSHKEVLLRVFSQKFLEKNILQWCITKYLNKNVKLLF